jgi:hypothetical protein
MVEHFKKRGLTTEKPSEDDEVNEEGGEKI